jgi:hypothetical protein
MSTLLAQGFVEVFTCKGGLKVYQHKEKASLLAVQHGRITPDELFSLLSQLIETAKLQHRRCVVLSLVEQGVGTSPTNELLKAAHPLFEEFTENFSDMIVVTNHPMARAFIAIAGKKLSREMKIHQTAIPNLGKAVAQALTLAT